MSSYSHVYLKHLKAVSGGCGGAPVAIGKVEMAHLFDCVLVFISFFGVIARSSIKMTWHEVSMGS